jgi:hypothetical protein
MRHASPNHIGLKFYLFNWPFLENFKFSEGVIIPESAFEGYFYLQVLLNGWYEAITGFLAFGLRDLTYDIRIHNLKGVAMCVWSWRPTVTHHLFWFKCPPLGSLLNWRCCPHMGSVMLFGSSAHLWVHKRCLIAVPTYGYIQADRFRFLPACNM